MVLIDFLVYFPNTLIKECFFTVGTSVQQPVTTEVPKLPQSRSFLKILPFILVLAVGFAVGFMAYKFITKEKQGQVSGNTIAESELPIAVSLLKNPIVGEWRGALEGTLTAKDSDSITINDDQKNSIKILLTVPPSSKINTLFFDSTQATSSGAPKRSVSLDSIPLGSYLRGDFIVVSREDRKDMIAGSLFTRIEKPQ